MGKWIKRKGKKKEATDIIGRKSSISFSGSTTILPYWSTGAQGKRLSYMSK